jgi:predicted nuclease of predicted toxin-antitoxin system
VRFVVDESADRQIADALRKAGHEVVSIAEISPGIADDVVLHLANDTEAVLVTCDKDFGELIFRQHRAHAGVVLVRLAGHSSDEKAAIVVAAVEAHQTEIQSRFCVVSHRAIRIRLPQVNPNI